MSASYCSPTCVVYEAYDVADPPPHPGPTWTRFVCISDTHSQKYDVPMGDVLLHAGDLTAWGYFAQLQKVMQWLEGLPHATKIAIAGNHDLCLDQDWVQGGKMANEAGHGLLLTDYTSSRELLSSLRSVNYLEYDTVRFTTAAGRTWEVYGSPATPRYATGAFQYRETSEGTAIYANIPPSTDILLTHTPPYGVCDRTKRDKLAGCQLLTSRLSSPDLQQCRLHIFGHIHEAHGSVVTPVDRGEGAPAERVSVNAAMSHSSPPIIIDLLN